MNRGLYGSAKRAPRGGLILLEEQTALASPSLNFNSWFRDGIDEYAIELLNIIPATDNVNLFLRVSTDGGASYDAGAGKYWHTGFVWVTGGAGQGGSTSATEIALNMASSESLDNSALWGYCGSWRLFLPPRAVPAQYTRLTGQYSLLRNTGPSLEGAMAVAAYLSTTPVNGLTFLMSSGNIASGIVRVYGVAK